MLKKNTLVLKFGGSSVADPECIRRISGIAIKEAEKHNVVVVVSAMGKTTDSLIRLATELSDQPEGRELDMLLATGELVTASLTAMTMQALGHPAVSMAGWQAGFITESEHNRARIAEIKTDRLIKHLNQGEIVVVAGFQGCTEDGEVTTLGRGGSDTSAVALAAALDALRCDIYTDVDGVYTTDPRIVPEARKLDYISYEEMLELAGLGAKVLHLRSVELAKKYNVDLRVLSSFKGCYDEAQDFEGKHRGTQVINLKRIEDMELTQAVTGVALDDKQAKVAILGVPDVPGIAAKIFLTLANRGISVDMIIQSVAQNNLNEIAFTVARDSLKNAETVSKEMLPELKAKEVVVDEDIAKVSVVGAGMLNKPGVASNMFKALADAGVNIQMISTSEIKISCMVSRKDAHKAVQAIHKAFELEKSNEPIIV